MSDTLHQLAEVLENRKQQPPEQSYVASLYAKGLDAILKKVGEEATETIIAAKNGNKEQLIYILKTTFSKLHWVLSQVSLQPWVG